MPILLEDDIISTLSFPETTIDINVSDESYSLDIALPSSEVFSIDIPGSGGVYLSGGCENNTLVVPDKSIAVVTFSEVGPAGPQGPPGEVVADLDRMVNPEYPLSRRTIEEVGGVVSAIRVYSDLTGGILLFERVFTYDLSGYITETRTEDMIGGGVLTKRFEYSGGNINQIVREVG